MKGEFTVAKTKEDEQLIFGWANVATRADGSVVEDWQRDIVTPEELEKAAYDHVLNFRSTGESHSPELREKGRLIESVAFTKEKLEAMGIPEGILPLGWWVGYRIDDLEAWDKIKKGEYNMFSIEGQGQRIPVEKKKGCAKSFLEIYEHKRTKRGKTAKSFLEIYEQDDIIKGARSFLEVYLEKFNPYHDTKGRFSSRGGFVSFSPGNNPTQAQRSIDRENKYRQGEGISGTVGGAFGNAERMTHAQVRRRLEELKNIKEKESQAAEYKPVKNNKEAEKWLVENGIAQNVNLTGVNKSSVDSINAMNEQLGALTKKYPIDTLGEIKVGSSTTGVLASASYHGLHPRKQFLNAPAEMVRRGTTDWKKNNEKNIEKLEVLCKELKSINSPESAKNLKRYEKLLNNYTERNKYDRYNAIYNGKEVKSVITHEYGHILADQYFMQINKVQRVQGQRKTVTIEDAEKQAKVTEVFETARARGDIYKISMYANSNAYEFFAESFAIKEMGIEKLPKYIDDMITEVLR